MTYNFYDTCSLLAKTSHLWRNPDELIIISSITLDELENIKTSANKDLEIKFTARRLLQELDEHEGSYKVVVWNKKSNDFLKQCPYNDTNDVKILIGALNYFSTLPKDAECYFITNDLNCKVIAKHFFEYYHLPQNIKIDKYTDNYTYTGIKEVILDEQGLLDFYENININYFDLLAGQYLIIRNPEGEIIDLRCWTGKEHRYLNTKPIESKWFGKVGPFKGDVYQKCAIDSLHNNQLTVMRGWAGTGKSCIALAYLFSLLEHHEIEKIIILCNPVATKDAAKLGLTLG